MHKSRLGAVIIDCQTEDLEREAQFWSLALGGVAVAHDPEGRYIDLRGDPAEPQMILQKVEHQSRIHLDIETDDRDAEVKRLESIGATVVETIARWTVMQAPSGHRFCIIGVRQAGFDKMANSWQ